MGKIALVLGATGGIGGAVAHRLQASGWQIRALHRAPDAVAAKHGFEWQPETRWSQAMSLRRRRARR